MSDMFFDADMKSSSSCLEDDRLDGAARRTHNLLKTKFRDSLNDEDNEDKRGNYCSKIVKILEYNL